MRRKKKRIKKIRNICIVLFLLICSVIVINFAPNYRKEENQREVKLIAHQKEITKNLAQDIIIDEEGIIYFSKEDVIKIFDDSLYEENNKIITRSTRQVAMLEKGKTTININGSNIEIQKGTFMQNGILYIPISELQNIYNIKSIYRIRSYICLFFMSF